MVSTRKGGSTKKSNKKKKDNEIINNEPTSKEKSGELLVKGNSAYRQQQFQNAVELFSSALDIDSANYKALKNRALAYMRLEDHENVILDTTAMLSADSNDVKMLYCRGVTNMKLSNYPGAFVDLNACKSLQPTPKEVDIVRLEENIHICQAVLNSAADDDEIMLSEDESDEDSTSNRSVVSSSVGDVNTVFGVNSSSDELILASLQSEFQRHVTNGEVVIEPLGYSQEDTNACTPISLAICALSQLMCSSLDSDMLRTAVKDTGQTLAAAVRHRGIAAYNDEERKRVNTDGLVSQSDHGFVSLTDCSMFLSEIFDTYGIDTEYEGGSCMLNIDQLRVGIEKLTSHLIQSETDISIGLLFGSHVVSVIKTETGGIELIETLACRSNPIHKGAAFRARCSDTDSLAAVLMLYMSNKMRNIPLHSEKRAYMALVMKKSGSGESMQALSQAKVIHKFTEGMWNSAKNIQHTSSRRLINLVGGVEEGIRSLFQNKEVPSLKATALKLYEISMSELDEIRVPLSKFGDCDLEEEEVDRVMKLCRFTPSGYEYCFKKTPETRTSTSYALFVIRDMIREATTGDDAVSDDAVPMQEEVCLVAEDDTETDEEIAPLPSRTKKAKAEKKEKEEDSASDDDMQEESSLPAEAVSSGIDAQDVGGGMLPANLGEYCLPCSSETAEEESVSSESGEEEQWDLTKIFSIKELNMSKPTMCDRANDGDVNCGLVACSIWEAKGQAPWNSCLDCQVNDYTGFPEEKHELPIDYMTEEHREIIAKKCSHPKKKKKFPDILPTTREEADPVHSAMCSFVALIHAEPNSQKKERLYYSGLDKMRRARQGRPLSQDDINMGYHLFEVSMMTRDDYHDDKGGCETGVDGFRYSLSQVTTKTTHHATVMMHCPRNKKGVGQFNAEGTVIVPEGSTRDDCVTLRVLQALSDEFMQSSVNHPSGWNFDVINISRSICEQETCEGFTHCLRTRQYEAAQRGGILNSVGALLNFCEVPSLLVSCAGDGILAVKNVIDVSKFTVYGGLYSSHAHTNSTFLPKLKEVEKQMASLLDRAMPLCNAYDLFAHRDVRVRAEKLQVEVTLPKQPLINALMNNSTFGLLGNRQDKKAVKAAKEHRSAPEGRDDDGTSIWHRKNGETSRDNMIAEHGYDDDGVSTFHRKNGEAHRDKMIAEHGYDDDGVSTFHRKNGEASRDKMKAEHDKKREDEIPGLVTIPAGSEQSILVHCTNTKCNNKEQLHTTMTIRREDAGCNNMKKGEQRVSIELYKDKAFTELIYTSEEGKSAAPQIIAELKDRHSGKHVPGRSSINSKIDDGTAIPVRNDNQFGKITHRYYAKKPSIKDMLKVLPRCPEGACRCDMVPVDESQKKNTISLQTLYQRSNTKKRKSTGKQKKGDSDNEVSRGRKKRKR